MMSSCNLGLLLCMAQLFAEISGGASSEEGGVCNDEVSFMQMGPGLLNSGARREQEGSLAGRMPHFLQDPVQPKMASEAEQNATRSSTNWTYEPKNDCLVNTGGTCSVDSCDDFRGKTKCSWDRCICSDGCSRADGICTKHKYKVVLDNFTIRDFRYGQYFYVSAMLYHVSTSGDNHTMRSRFKLVETPDGAFILYSKSEPDYAITISDTKENLYSRLSVLQANVKGDSTEVLDSAGDPSVSSLAIILTEPPGGYDDSHRPEAYRFKGERPVMLQSFRHQRQYIYSPYIGDALECSHDDPGDGGLFIFDPPLPMQYFTGRDSGVKDFRGFICSYDCHGPGSKSFWWAVWVTGAMISLIILGCCGCFWWYWCLKRLPEQGGSRPQEEVRPAYPETYDVTITDQRGNVVREWPSLRLSLDQREV